MKPTPSPRERSPISASGATGAGASIALLFGLFAVAAGAAVLAGWLFDVPVLKSLLPGLATMKANAAIGFILAGLSLALLGRAARSGCARQLSRMLAVATALLGTLTLCEYLFRWDLGIDQLLFREAAGAVGALSSGRMAPASAVNFLLLGCAIFLAGFRRAIPTAQRLALVAGLVGLLPLVGDVYGATEMVGVGRYTQMAVHTTVLFILLSLGLLLLHPADGLMRAVTGDTVGGWLLRHLLPFIFGVPLVLGWLGVQGEQRNFFNGPLGVALMMVIMMLIAGILTAWAGRSLNRMDAVRRQAEERAQEREAFSRAVLNAVGANIAVLDRNGVITMVNHAWMEFARNNGDASHGAATGAGADYLAVTRAARGASTEGAAEALAGIQDVLAGRAPEFAIEYPCHSPDEQRWFMLHVTPLAGKAGGVVLAHVNITARKLAETRRALSAQILATLNRNNNVGQLARDILRLIKEETGMEAVGLRLREGDDFPYYETKGFPTSFVETERTLCAQDEKGKVVRDANGRPVLDCMCGNVICGRTDPKLPFLTPRGSFWTNSTTELLATTTEKERHSRTRNRCNSAGYESVALVPLRSGDETVGLLQLNDHRRGMFTPDKVQFFEEIGASIGIAVTRWRVGAALRESEEKFRNLFNNAEVGMFRSRFDGSELLELNDKYLSILGKTREETVGKPSAILWADPNEREEMVKTLRAKGHGENLECKMIKKGGEVITCVTSLRLYPEQGILEGSIIDITERKRAEVAIREHAEELQTILKTTMEGFFMFDAKGRFLEVNDTYCAMMGYSREELLRMCIPDVEVDEKPAEVAAVIQRIVQAGRAKFERRQRRKDGTLVNLDVSVNSVEAGGKRFVCFLRDVTERKRAEAALRESEQRFRTLFNDAPIGVAIDGADGRYIDANKAFCGILGYSEEELVGKKVAEVIHPDDRGSYLKSETNLVSGASPGYAAERRFVRKDGSVLLGRVVARAIYNADGKFRYRIAMFEDITERKRAEQALRESEENYKSLFQSSRDATMTSEMPSGRFTSGNPAAVKLFGARNEEEFVRYAPYDLSPEKQPDGRPSAEKAREMIETAIREGAHFFEWTHRRVGGEEFPADVLLTRIDRKGKLIILGTVRDITERKRAEKERTALQDQLRQAQKMESVGQLAGGVAHDFNNLLTGISGYTELTFEKLDAASPMRDDLAEVLRLTKRAADVTRQLLAFSRRQALQPQVLNINGMVAETAGMLKRLLSENIDLHFTPAPDLGNVRADPIQMEQVLMNLAINARDAMPAGGSLTIETANVELDADYAARHISVIPGRYVMVAVSDTGHGMDAATQSHLFEPFFTTKEKSKGTGLGLATAYGIVKQHGGNIWVYSEPGKGATFKIYLPRIEEAAGAGQPPAEAAVQGGGETVLIVEDESSVRDVAERALKARGYAVLTAGNAEEAESLFSGHPGRISLLVTDVVLPGINGPRLYDRLRAADPSLKVLYMSGHTDDAILHQRVLDPNVVFMQKPFTLEMIARKVRQVLDG